MTALINPYKFGLTFRICKNTLVSMYVKRIAEKRIIDLLSVFPSLAVTGPRQSGKTTMLRQLLPNYSYISFDTLAARNLFEDDPQGFISSLGSNVILDEVQKVPQIFEWIKSEIDNDRTPGRFLLTGTSQFTMTRSITESLAGRCGFVTLLPLQFAEYPQIDLDKAELGGWYPEILLRNWTFGREWYEGYITTYLERDVRNLLNIGNLRDFRIVLGLLASRTAQELNLSSVAREAGVTEKTIASWISVLEASYIIFLVKPFHRNLGKRLIKRPKLYFWDTGLVCYLTGQRTPEQVSQGSMGGAIFENLVIADLYKNTLHQGLDRQFFYFRTNAGLEIDLVEEDFSSRKLTLYEIKRRETTKPEDTKNIRTLLASSSELVPPHWTVEGLVLNKGKDEITLSSNIHAVRAEQYISALFVQNQDSPSPVKDVF